MTCRATYASPYPVGAAVPLLLTPDAHLRFELAQAVGSSVQLRERLQQTVAKMKEAAADATLDLDHGVVMPPPVALLSMLGAVLVWPGRCCSPYTTRHVYKRPETHFEP